MRDEFSGTIYDIVSNVLYLLACTLIRGILTSRTCTIHQYWLGVKIYPFARQLVQWVGASFDKVVLVFLYGYGSVLSKMWKEMPI